MPKPQHLHQNALTQRADEARYLHETFRKFVPSQYVQHLSAGNANDLALGHADEDDVAIMFVDIRQFTTLAEALSPQQLLNFLNAYFTRMNAPIHLNHGFIDKFIGDAIMALFDRKSPDTPNPQVLCRKDALLAAKGICEALTLYNRHRQQSGYQEIDIGIGIHYGNVIMGTVGSDDRMDTTVIGDTVNIAARLQDLNKRYGTRTLITESMLSDAHAMSDSCCVKFIDEVTLTGRTSPTKIYAIDFN